MFYLAILRDSAWLEPLLGQSGRWLNRDIEWVVLVVVGIVTLILFCSVIATGLALLCSFAVLLRTLFGALISSQHLPDQLMFDPAEPSLPQSQTNGKVLPLEVRGNRWAK